MRYRAYRVVARKSRISKVARTHAGATLTRMHRAAQSRIADDMRGRILDTWPMLDPSSLDKSIDRWIAATLPDVIAGRKVAVDTASNYLKSFSYAESGKITTVIPSKVTAASAAAITTSLRVTGPITIKTLTASGFSLDHSVATALEGVTGASVRHALDGGRDTVRESVANDPNTFGWKRIGGGTSTCNFCLMLIGRGEVYWKDTANFASHDNCQCTAEPDYEGGPRPTPTQYVATKRRVTDADRARVRAYLVDM